MLKGFLRAFKDNTKDVEDIKISKWLDKEQIYAVYLLTDSKPYRVARFFQDNGLHIHSASSNISKIGGKFIMDIEPSILLFIDTGKGSYSSAKARKELIDVIGAGDLSMNKAVIVFYSDSSMKNEALQKLQNTDSIKWLKYSGSQHALLKMLSAGIRIESNNKKYEDDFKNIKCQLEPSGTEEHRALNSETVAGINGIFEAFNAVATGNSDGEDMIDGFTVTI